MTGVAPQVSVCIANYNGIDIIDACLKSVLSQQLAPSYEILVHDDASTDGSADYLRTRYPQVRLIESAQNVGFCRANNRMAAQARGTYLLLLNNDATLHADALETLLAEAERLASGAVLGLPQFDSASGELVDRGCMLDPFFNPVPNRDPSREDVMMLIGACLWIPAGLWRQLGGFPEWFESIAEDMYLCGRARLCGFGVRVPARSGYSHRQGHSFGGNRISDSKLSTTYRRRALSERNKTFVLVLLSPAVLLLPLLLMHLLVLLAEGMLLTMVKRDTRIWREIYGPVVPALWRFRQQWWSLRRVIQSQRTIGTGSWLQGFVPTPYKLAMLVKHGWPRLR